MCLVENKAHYDAKVFQNDIVFYFLNKGMKHISWVAREMPYLDPDINFLGDGTKGTF